MEDEKIQNKLVKAALASAEEIASELEPKERPYVPTPWGTLNAVLRGWEGGRIYHFYGEEGIGKTTLAVNIFYHLLHSLEEKRIAIYLAVEPERREVKARLEAIKLGDENIRWSELARKDPELDADPQVKEVRAEVSKLLQTKGRIIEARRLLLAKSSEALLLRVLTAYQGQGFIPTVLILDTWTDWAESRAGDVFSNERLAASRLADLADAFQMGMVTVGHTRKSSGALPSHSPYKEPDPDSERGSKALRRMSDAVFGVWKEADPGQPHTYLATHKNRTPWMREGKTYISLKYYPYELLQDDPGHSPSETEGEVGYGPIVNGIIYALMQWLKGKDGIVYLEPAELARVAGLSQEAGKRPGRTVTSALKVIGIPLGERIQRESGGKRTSVYALDVKQSLIKIREAGFEAALALIEKANAP